MTYQKQFSVQEYYADPVVICFQNFIFDISETVLRLYSLLCV
ncbi:hypothetical protein BRDCF_p1868 [Bacteroidales bacterium CF]|nr:hypothetical protein BRDCF_p1868 [Bacteroidales bacterium CF]